MTFDRQLEDFQRTFVAARANRWHGGDLLDEQFLPYLGAIGNQPDGYGMRFARREECERQRVNPWAEPAAGETHEVLRQAS